VTSVNVSTVTNTITVTDGDNGTTVVTVPVTNTVTATTVGPQGPAGVGYLHQQTSSSTTWVINHNLGFRPAVELFDSGSQEIDGDVAHPSVNQAIITLSPATTGTARLT
jgi:hypothetical protein